MRKCKHFIICQVRIKLFNRHTDDNSHPMMILIMTIIFSHWQTVQETLLLNFRNVTIHQMVFLGDNCHQAITYRNDILNNNVAKQTIHLAALYAEQPDQQVSEETTTYSLPIFVGITQYL